MNNYLMIFFNINIMLLISYLGYKLFFFLKDKSIVNHNKKSILNHARIILLSAIVLPIIFSNFNIKSSLPSLDYSEFHVFSEFETKQLKTNINMNSISTGNDMRSKHKKDYSLIYLLLFFLVGVIISLLNFTIQLKHLNDLLAKSILHRKFKRYKIYISHLVESPFTFLNLFGPIVVIPSNIIGSKNTLSLALQHENQHIRQKDIYWAFAFELAKAPFWFNPAIYLWSNLLRELSELACDEELIERKKNKIKDYGNCLVDVATNAMHSKISFDIAAGMATDNKLNNSFLLRRIEMLKNKKMNKGSKAKLITKAMGLVSIIFMLTMLTRVQASIAKVTTSPVIQSMVESILRSGLKKANAQTGFAIVADPNTGQIMALSRLKLKNGKYENLVAEDFLNETYEPASHIKPIIAAIALEKGIMHENTILNAKGGKLRIGDRYFHDWKDHGNISLIDTVANSSNIGTYRIAKSIGETNLIEEIEKFGFDKGSSVDKTSFARSGIIKFATGENKKFNLIYFVNGMGNVQVSPLETLQAYSSIANGGKLLRPKVYTKGKAQIDFIRNPIGQDTANRMKNILLRTMTQGTGKWAQSSKYTIAGKTATGYITNRHKGKKANRAQFIGFAPFNNPKLIALVMVDNPKGGAHGSKHAAPVVRSILNKSLTKLGVKPDRFNSSN